MKFWTALSLTWKIYLLLPFHPKQLLYPLNMTVNLIGVIRIHKGMQAQDAKILNPNFLSTKMFIFCTAAEIFVMMMEHILRRSFL